MLYSLNDFTIIPAKISEINSRKECNVLTEKSMFPLFTAPMSCVIDNKNFEIFLSNGVQTIIPRSVDLTERMLLSEKTFVAMSLEEFENEFVDETFQMYENYYICIDIANGHMKKLLDLCKKAKEIHGDKLVLIAGNIANPETYLEYAKVGIDYVRIGIGSGNVCTTSANTGVHYPMGSLIQECFNQKEIILKLDRHIERYKKLAIESEKEQNINTLNAQLQLQNDYHKERFKFKSIPKIIADGGFKNFDQIIKALALGADYVMLGEIFAKTEEACGEMHVPWFGGQQNTYTVEVFKDKCKRMYPYTSSFNIVDTNDFSIYREYYGMSTRRAQEEFGKTENKTAEGISKLVTIDYTLAQWIDNFKHYLQSAMSYTNSRTLKEFSNCKIEVMSNQSFNSFYK